MIPLSLLEFKNVSYRGKDKTILQNVSFQVEPGDFVSIVGPSGSGKSTILRLSCNLISPTEGNIFFDGIDYQQYKPTELRKNIIYCFQSPYLFGTTVMENLTFPYKIRNMEPDFSRIHTLFEKFHMSSDYLERDVFNLSGGEKQRIALIRSMIFVPKILLLDEITSALDVDNTLLVEEVIQSWNKEGLTVLWITHNPEQSRKYANKILTIEAGKKKSFEEVI